MTEPLPIDGEPEELIEWFGSFLAIVCTTLRALNSGYQGPSYLASCIAYVIFIIYGKKQNQRLLNIFYLITGLVGAYRWWGI